MCGRSSEVHSVFKPQRRILSKVPLVKLSRRVGHLSCLGTSSLHHTITTSIERCDTAPPKLGMAAVRNYKYKKLNRNGSEIRLLEVCPAEGVEDRLKCRLVNVKPIDDLEFIGLSAVAGDFSKTETIVLNNNQRVAIPADLGEALRHLRAALQPDQLTTPAWLTHLWKGMRDLRQDQSGKLLVWTAELCVNPHDPQEQAGRREHMRLAYRKAKMVVGWLGPRDETSDTAVEIIRTIDRAMPANFGLPDDKLKHPENYAPRCEWLDELKWFWEVPAGLDDPRDSLVFRSISQFMSRPYLQSDWVLQEIAMATCPSFLVGDKMISWKQSKSL